ncbi:serine/threonine protein kinase, partial [Candidatus Margulisiibacteriota bacterium]
ITMTISGQPITQRFVVLEEFGAGGQAMVKRVLNQTQGNRIEVFKVAFEQYAKDENFRARFFGEADMLASLDPLKHPNVVKVFGSGELDGAPFYSMEYIAGASLEKLLGRSPQFSMLAATRMMLEIAYAFGGIHAEGIVHRDVKPDNILLSDDLIKVIDFGIARDSKIVHKLTQTGTVFGTPEYMAYEQHQGRGIDHRTDIFAEGAIFFRLLTGQVPFPLMEGEAYGSYIGRIMPLMQENHVPQIKDHLPNIDAVKLRPVLEHLQNMFNKLLVANIDYRYEDNNLFIQDLKVLEQLLIGHGEKG